MSSAFVYPSQLHDNSRARMQEPRHIAAHDNTSQARPGTPGDSTHLSPFSSGQTHSNSASPTLNHTHTPAESVSTLSVHYQSSDLSEVDEDPFFGVDFSDAGGTPSFLDDPSFHGSNDHLDQLVAREATPERAPSHSHGEGYPMSPEQTPSLHTSPQQARGQSSRAVAPLDLSSVNEPYQSAKPFYPLSNNRTAPQLTPDASGSGTSSEDGLAPTSQPMPSQSPRINVSFWGRDNGESSRHAATSAPEADSPVTVRAGMSMDDTFVPTSSTMFPARDGGGNWIPNADTGHRGLDPDNRPPGEIPSANDMATRRKIADRNNEVDEWLASSTEAQPGVNIASEAPLNAAEGVSDREISPGGRTRNVMQSGRTYYIGEGGSITDIDTQIIHQNRNWEDAPAILSITDVRYQPESSQAAIQRFERLCQDNESIVSRAATWGTRRRSLPSTIAPSIAPSEADVEGVTSGNFLKKLSISRGDPRRPSIFKELRKVPSQLLKRTRSGQDDEISSGPDSVEEKKDVLNNLAPPKRAMSWGKRQPMPSINTALVSMGNSVASIGTTHARSGSISTTPPVTSPRSPFRLQVANPLRRPRSKSDLPKTSTDTSHPSLVGMWKKTGGPPVASLATTHVAVDPDDDDDDDDEMLEDAELKEGSTKLIDGIAPNFQGFSEHVLKLNPMLSERNTYLVDRIAHQQIVRYKALLSSRVKHINHVQNRTCPCHGMCIALGGSATVLDGKNDPRGGDPLSARYDPSDGDITPLEGTIVQESFPQDIPMPPTQTLPAEFECQLCYQAKKFQKPSDWTKHVHEDVQPFTCTWDRCRDPKIFKRKADWVRHENEGHRHLEWWTCDVDDCRHTCYRRDNFLQHLVREHKFPEPKVKTKAAIKRAGGIDPTWQKVEKCHAETPVRPQDEPCRFCGKSFPTWKKLTVHLAKHMEQISLPILRLVAQKELEADTIISPVQDPPPRSFAPTPVKQEPPMTLSPSGVQMAPNHAILYGNPQSQRGPFAYPPVSTVSQFQAPYYPNQYDGLPSHMPSLDARLDVSHMNSGFGVQPQFQNIPVTTGPYVGAHNQYMAVPTHDTYGNMPMNSLGLTDPSGAPLSYDNMMDPASAGGEHYTPQGSVSPYSHSPNQASGQFYSQ